MCSPGSVSYTHLDVYKRQGYVSGIAEGCSLHVVDRATVPEERYAPSSAKYAALAGLLGAALSCAWVVMSGLAAELKGSAACAAYKGR